MIIMMCIAAAVAGESPTLVAILLGGITGLSVAIAALWKYATSRTVKELSALLNANVNSLEKLNSTVSNVALSQQETARSVSRFADEMARDRENHAKIQDRLMETLSDVIERCPGRIK